jgi:hypothetical protein
MAISYLSMSEKTDNTTRQTANEYNEIKDALTDGTKSIKTQCVQMLTVNYTEAGALNVGGTANLNSTDGAMSLTLADPDVAGIHMLITMGTDGGDVTITTESVGGWDSTNNTATFNDVGDSLYIVSISSTKWLILKNSGVTLSAV